MKSIYILFVVLAVVHSWRPPRFEQGDEVGPSLTVGHILGSGTQPNRYVDTLIVFETPFINLPRVAVGNKVLNFENIAPTGFIIDVSEITRRGFTIRCSALTARQYYSVRFQWFATDDPRFFVIHARTNNMASLATGANVIRTEVFNIPITGYNFPGPVQATAFVQGVNWVQQDRSNLILFTRVTAATATQVTVQMRTESTNMIEFVKLCIVMSPVLENIQMGAVLGARPIPSHSWLIGTGDRFEEGLVPLTNLMRSGDRGSVSGFAGFNLVLDQAPRVMIRSIVYGARSAVLKFGTFGPSHIAELYITYLLYKSDDYKVFSDTCAEVFSECNFGGQTFQICDANRNIPATGFTGSVRSLSLPPNKSLTLFNRVDLQGRQVTFTESQACLTGLNFRLA